MAERVIVKQSQLGIPIGNKIVLGQLTTFKDGEAKWTYARDIGGLGDQSTFTSTRQPNGTWVWSQTTSSSISNLAKRENLTTDQVNRSLYVKSGNLPTSQTQTVLNAGRNTHLGLSEAKRLGLPGASGTATVTGTLPSQVSGGQNSKTTGGEPPSEITSSTSQDELLSNKSIQSSEKNKNAAPLPGAGGASPLSYPLNRDPNQDYIKFLMYEFSPKKFLASGGNAELGARLADRSDTKNIVGSVTLPIQPTISDSNIVNWNEDVLDAATQVFGKISLGAILGGPSGAETETKNQVNNMDPEGTKALVAGSLANAATGTNKNLFTRTTGAIVNPNAELLFQSPGLRSFTFTFTLSAREEKEAVAIRSIIRFFKQGMAAKRAESTLFLKSPNTFGIKYMYGSGEHPWINKIKECALQNFSVNYTPAGNYATYSDGAMTSYELTMSFTELDPIYFDEYKSPNEIGY